MSDPASSHSALSRVAEASRRLARATSRYPRLAVGLGMLLATFATYYPFRAAPDVLYRYWDGPHYAYLAKTLYAVPEAHPFRPYQLTPAYYATHFPAYPLLIRALTPLTLGSYLPAMLLATTLSSVAAAVLFYEIVSRFKLVVSPVWTGLLFCVLPPRWVIYHSVGASEPLFLCFVFASLLAFRADRQRLVIVFVMLASLTRIMGVLLIPVFIAEYLLRRRYRSAAAMPLALLGVAGLFMLHRLWYGDFLAYFSRNLTQSQHLSASPLAIVRSYSSGADTHSAEFFLLMYAVYGLGSLALSKERVLLLFSLTFFSFNCFVFHYDLARMFIPMAPFALLVGFDSVLSRPACRLVLPLALYVVYTYAWGQIPQNLVVPGVFDELVRALR